MSADAKRIISRLLDQLPTDTLDAVLADVQVPSQRVTAADKELAAAYRSDTITAADIAAARHQEACARIMHRVAAAMLVDSLRVQTAGSGDIAHDASFLVNEVQK